ncbi:MAG: serine hydrolase [Verrucomicrobia bacterium]|nr:serine hydrolase [Verrucomicrobiota bacterium]
MAVAAVGRLTPWSQAAEASGGSAFHWRSASPASEGFSSSKMDAVWTNLLARGTTAFLVIRNDAVVFERYADGWSRTRPHYTASLAKAFIGGLSLMLAMEDGRIRPDDRASRFVPPWRGVERKQDITVRHLTTHTSGIEDAEAAGLPHDQLPGWKGEFWKPLAPPRDPFSLARDAAPVLDVPGTRARYSNPGMAMLAYCVTASLRGSTNADLRSLLRHRVMQPLDVPENEWGVGYGATTEVDGLPLVANWGGGSYSQNAIALVGRLLLRGGDWQGRQLLRPEIVTAATTHAGEPNNSGLGSWVNREADGSLHWKSAPADAFWGAGAGHQFLFVVPSLNLIVVRSGEQLDNSLAFDEALEMHVVAPLMTAFASRVGPPVPPSPVIKSLTWAPANTIVRAAKGSDNWPLTWAADDQLYTAYGDGNGFEPLVPEKLSLGFARISGGPTNFSGANIRSPTGEQRGDGRAGRKASGLLCVDGVLYVWARNATNAQLAWSTDHGVTWRWSDWRFGTSFGCPAFVNFGRDYAGARDEFVYVYSPDSDSAYTPADRFVLARVPKRRVRERAAYEFFAALDASGAPVWTKDLAQRGAVFTNAGRCLRSQMTHCAPLQRYLWWQQLPRAPSAADRADSRFTGGFGVYDAPEPWGPWTAVYFTERWDTGPGETASFPTKWMSADGRTLHLVFSGDDSFSVRRATLGLWTPPASK